MVLPFGKRQTVLTFLMGFLVLIAGCSAIIGESDGNVELGQITVENSDDTGHTIHVLVESDSEPVYGASVALDGISPPANESDFGSIDSAILNHSAWRGDSANWTVYTRVDSNTSWQAHVPPADTESDCISVRLIIETDATVTSFTPVCASWPPTTNT
ncbi:hypothetical protein EGH23_18650 [Halomicroarcula sp. F27]|uniref:Secreted protein n=1 Tax=Haloarcula nitratireducens TaxID=2487749 RepID=A0AAW4PGN1_9EURY|nr:hypothetical protein [Halomicroarcula nitratireducens]